MIPEFLDWKFLPDLLLEQIFSYLPWRDRLSASCTCILWNQTFYSPRLWKELIYIPPLYLEKYSTRFHYDNATYNLSKCFRNIGYSFQNLFIPPTSDFFILNRALNVMSDFYSSQNKKYRIDEEINPLCDFRSKLENFSFEFANQIENGSAYGTGGALLSSIRKLLDILSQLKSLRLKGLLLTSEDRIGLLEGFIKNNKDSLLKLSLVDISKSFTLEYDVINFSNLTELELSPFQICSDLLINVIQQTKIGTLILTQTSFTLFSEEFATLDPIPSYVWELVNNINPNLKVYQYNIFNNISEFVDLETVSIIHQPRPAPITRYTFSSNNISLLDLSRLEQYYHTLAEIILVVNSATASSVCNVIDEDLLWISSSSPNLVSLVIGGERISVHSLTVLFMLSVGCRKLKKLIIEMQTLIYNIDNISPEIFPSSLSNDLIAASSSSELFRQAVSASLKLPNWNTFTRQHFIKFIEKYNFIS